MQSCNWTSDFFSTYCCIYIMLVRHAGTSYWLKLDIWHLYLNQNSNSLDHPSLEVVDNGQVGRYKSNYRRILSCYWKGKFVLLLSSNHNNNTITSLQCTILSQQILVAVTDLMLGANIRVAGPCSDYPLSISLADIGIDGDSDTQYCFGTVA